MFISMMLVLYRLFLKKNLLMFDIGKVQKYLFNYITSKTKSWMEEYSSTTSSIYI